MGGRRLRSFSVPHSEPHVFVFLLLVPPPHISDEISTRNANKPSFVSLVSVCPPASRLAAPSQPRSLSHRTDLFHVAFIPVVVLTIYHQNISINPLFFFDQSQDIYVPDENSELVPWGLCLHNDSPSLAGRVDPSRLRCLHPRVSLEDCRRLRIPSVSQVRGNFCVDLFSGGSFYVVFFLFVGVARLWWSMNASELEERGYRGVNGHLLYCTVFGICNRSACQVVCRVYSHAASASNRQPLLLRRSNKHRAGWSNKRG